MRLCDLSFTKCLNSLLLFLCLLVTLWVLNLAVSCMALTYFGQERKGDGTQMEARVSMPQKNVSGIGHRWWGLCPQLCAFTVKSWWDNQPLKIKFPRFRPLCVCGGGRCGGVGGSVVCVISPEPDAIPGHPHITAAQLWWAILGPGFHVPPPGHWLN